MPVSHNGNKEARFGEGLVIGEGRRVKNSRWARLLSLFVELHFVPDRSSHRVAFARCPAKLVRWIDTQPEYVILMITKTSNFVSDPCAVKFSSQRCAHAYNETGTDLRHHQILGIGTIIREM